MLPKLEWKEAKEIHNIAIGRDCEFSTENWNNQRKVVF